MFFKIGPQKLKNLQVKAHAVPLVIYANGLSQKNSVR